MPAKECDNGKWKWGENGSCVYDSKEAAEKDNEDYYQNAINDEVDFTMNFTKEEMEKLHNDGEIIIEVEGDDGDKMNILFTYASEEIENENEDERDESFDPLGPHKDEEKREEIKDEDNKDVSFYDTERNKPLIRKVENLWEKTITMEKRYFNIETRTEKREDGTTTITGHAAVFNTRSSDLGGFREIIAPGAFRDALNKDSLDCRCLINHDPNLVLARATKNGGTLKLEETAEGLQYSFDVPDTTYGKDIIVSMERGDVSQSSFAFTIEEDSWETTADGEIRTITKIRDLWDTSIVTYPAYPDANDLTLAKRSLALHKEKEENKKQEKDLVQRSLLALKIELKKRK
tara:strand:- start:1392 stop:2432 length:1041 start_codon:yes stop_codon:yes gene_type:complete